MGAHLGRHGHRGAGHLHVGKHAAQRTHAHRHGDHRRGRSGIEQVIQAPVLLGIVDDAAAWGDIALCEGAVQQHDPTANLRRGQFLECLGSHQRSGDVAGRRVPVGRCWKRLAALEQHRLASAPVGTIPHLPPHGEPCSRHLLLDVRRSSPVYGRAHRARADTIGQCLHVFPEPCRMVQDSLAIVQLTCGSALSLSPAWAPVKHSALQACACRLA